MASSEPDPVRPILAALGGALVDALYPPRCPACGKDRWRAPHGNGAAALCRACREDWPAGGRRCRRCGRLAWFHQAHPDGGLPGCQRCAGPLAERDAFGQGARRAARGVRIRPAALAEVRVGASYRGAPRALILGLKHRAAIGAVPLLVEPMRRALAAPPIDADGVVPMPQSLRRRIERGVHPAGELARPLAEELDVALEPRALAVRAHRGIQRDRSRAQRLAAPRGSFRARARRVRGRRILLVDDVLTSGGTAWAAALALKRAGAERVALVVACRAR